ARHQYRYDSGRHRRHEHRHGDSDSLDRIGQHMDDHRHDGGRQDSPNPQVVLEKKIERQHRRDHGAADIYGDNGAGPIDHDRHDVAHAEEEDFTPRLDLACREFPYWNIDVAADQRAQQQQQCGARTDAKARVDIAQHIDLDENDDNEEYAGQNG